MSGKPQSKGPLNTPPKYLNDFSKALANEVRILLQEVGQLRDERRQLQYEIAELMAMKSKHGAGGEYTADWKPPMPPPMPEPLPPLPAEPLPIEPAKPAWRIVERHEKRSRLKQKATPASAPPPAIADTPPPQPQLAAWAQWKPNPLLSPIPRVATATAPLPAPPKPAEGLFGPRTPPPK